MKNIFLVVAILSSFSTFGQSSNLGVKLSFSGGQVVTASLKDGSTHIPENFLADFLYNEENNIDFDDKPKEVVIPDGVTEIKKRAFGRGSESIMSITIPKSVTKIGVQAFSGCDNLQHITMPESGIEIEYAFIGCDKIQTINGKPVVKKNGGLVICGTLYMNTEEFVGETYTVLSGVTKIAPCAFRECENLKTIILPNGIKEVEYEVFRDCENLQSVTIPESVEKICEKAFDGCKNLRNITLPKNLKTIEADAFAFCENLQSITIPENVTSIGNGAFECCFNLASIIIPQSVTSIGTKTFKYCSNLSSITIPESVTSIRGYAFSGCEKLASIIIPGSVESIGMRTFDDCSSLASVYCKALDPPALDRFVFSDKATNMKIYVPAESVSAYKTAEYWSDYADCIVGYEF